jgi:hypothetical protein
MNPFTRALGPWSSDGYQSSSPPVIKVTKPSPSLKWSCVSPLKKYCRIRR